MPKPQTPQTLTALARILSRHRGRALIVSDGDSISRPPAKRVVVDVTGIRGFSSISVRGPKVQIGAGAKLGDVLREVRGENGLLKQAISMMANPLVRNRVTVFSALALDSPYLDLATALVSLRARVRVQTAASSRLISLEEFLLTAAAGLKGGEFPASVEFRMLDPRWRVGFFRVNPGRGRATVSSSVRMRMSRNAALEPEIVVSSSTVIPVRLPLASRALSRRVLSDANVKTVAQTAATEILEMSEVEDDPYERSLVEVAVSRAIRRVTETPSAT